VVTVMVTVTITVMVFEVNERSKPGSECNKKKEDHASHASSHFQARSPDKIPDVGKVRKEQNRWQKQSRWYHRLTQQLAGDP
jgi:hypothetical protein